MAYRWHHEPEPVVKQHSHLWICNWLEPVQLHVSAKKCDMHGLLLFCLLLQSCSSVVSKTGLLLAAV